MSPSDKEIRSVRDSMLKGSYYTIPDLSQKTGLSYSELRHALNQLKREGRVKTVNCGAIYYTRIIID